MKTTKTIKTIAAIRAASAPHTELRGLVRDQAELDGVLESLHLPIVKIDHADEDR